MCATSREEKLNGPLCRLCTFSQIFCKFDIQGSTLIPHTGIFAHKTKQKDYFPTLNIYTYFFFLNAD
jgi:hypothetical protein